MASVNKALRCRKRFLRIFPGGFRDDTYLDWERDYKWESHKRWRAALRREEFQRLLDELITPDVFTAARVM